MASAVIEHAASGDNTIIAAPGANKSIRVLGYTLIGAGAVNARWKSGASSNRSGPLTLTAGTGASPAVSKDGQFDCNPNESLVLNLSLAVAVNGHVTYVVV